MAGAAVSAVKAGMLTLSAPAFEALCTAFEEAPDDVARVRIATAFFSRLGDGDALDSGLDAVAMGQALGQNPAACCLEVGKENHDEEALIDAALYAARS